MKIRVTVRETVYKTLEVDTIDFGMEETTTWPWESFVLAYTA